MTDLTDDVLHAIAERKMPTTEGENVAMAVELQRRRRQMKELIRLVQYAQGTTLAALNSDDLNGDEEDTLGGHEWMTDAEEILAELGEESFV